MAGTQQSGHWGKLIDEKNRKSKIWCPCTFKNIDQGLNFETGGMGHLSDFCIIFGFIFFMYEIILMILGGAFSHL